MDEPKNSFKAYGCQRCANASDLGFELTMAFQPIVSTQSQTIFGYEALVRGTKNESAISVMSQVTEEKKYAFDQQCRVKAISMAAKLGMTSILSINFLPNAIYSPERCISTTLQAAKAFNFPIQNIMFEFTEVERMDDFEHTKNIISHYNKLGFKTAVDDFGSGFSGLNRLANFKTNIVKIDMDLIRNIHQDKVRQVIIRRCLQMFEDLGVTPLVEGIETLGEYQWLRAQGVDLMQGYLFAKPGFESLPDVNFSSLSEFE
ncbi:EAL domain-containing protein [Vibrio sp. SCSIO 43132]|uniref:EAL domain-containing protein n=1 Tax=Vibrio sp. SCSIO 43132 TaxID=2779363 RepID=UPI00223AD87B|nr:EAL domain-containing protein [Vibrio sp. SCSIO 43132]UAB73214.1 EAL domain-containing protein [Vibrio sp. SCSIO 43132]